MRTHDLWPRTGRIAAVAGLMLLAAPSAHAAVTNDTNDFNLTESVSIYAAYATTQTGGPSFRWLDVPSKNTYVAAGNCATNAAPAGERYYSAGSTSYQNLGWPTSSNACFFLRGRTAPGQGAMTFYDGRISR